MFDVIGEMQENEKAQGVIFDADANNPDLLKAPDQKKDEGHEDSQEEHEAENSDGEEFINFFDRDEIESTVRM